MVDANDVVMVEHFRKIKPDGPFSDTIRRNRKGEETEEYHHHHHHQVLYLYTNDIVDISVSPVDNHLSCYDIILPIVFYFGFPPFLFLFIIPVHVLLVFIVFLFWL